MPLETRRLAFVLLLSLSARRGPLHAIIARRCSSPQHRLSILICIVLFWFWDVPASPVDWFGSRLWLWLSVGGLETRILRSGRWDVVLDVEAQAFASKTDTGVRAEIGGVGGHWA